MTAIKIIGIIIIILLIILAAVLFFPAAIDVKADKTGLRARICGYIGAFKIKFELSGDNIDAALYLFGKRMNKEQKNEYKPNENAEKSEDRKNKKENKEEKENQKEKKKGKRENKEKKEEKEKADNKSDIGDNISFALELIGDKNISSVIIRIIRQILELPRYKRYDAYVKFGFESPADTGMLYGFLCAVFSAFKHRPRLEPDFNNEVFDFSVDIKGYFNVCKLLVFVVKLVLDDELSDIIKMFKERG